MILEDLRRLWGGLDIGQKFGITALMAITLVAVTFLLMKSTEPNWSVLYSDLSESDAVSVSESIKKSGHPVKLSKDKKAVLVPSNLQDDLRIYVAQNDLIQDREHGFELLDELQLGSTDFKNQLTKQRIFQGELTRSIERINGIAKARVQIAEPERSVFADKDEAPTASVILILEPGYRIKSEQVKAIKNLVAYAVPRLTPDRVFLTDQSGNSLTDEVGGNSSDIESYKANVENQTAKKVQSVLEKIVGRGNVSVQVSADIDFNSAKSTIESYIPVEGSKEGVLVSSQTEVESYENPNSVPNPTNVNQRNLNYSKQKTAMNYNVTKEVKQVIYAPGTVKRLSIAVAVNKILTAEEKNEIKELVLSASGVDYARGDIISISGLQFEGASIDRKFNDEMAKQYEHEFLIETITSSVIPLIIVLVLGCFALVVLKGFVSKIPTPKQIEKKVVEEAPKVIEEEEVHEATPQIQFNKKELQSQKDQSITELNEAIMSSPEDAAKLLTSFIRE